jgi:hypothetical protein
MSAIILVGALFFMVLAVLLWGLTRPQQGRITVEASINSGSSGTIRSQRTTTGFRKLLSQLPALVDALGEFLIHYRKIIFVAIGAIILFSGIYLVIVTDLTSGIIILVLAVAIAISAISTSLSQRRSRSVRLELDGDVLEMPSSLWRGLEFSGEVSFPKRVYIGDSRDISLELSGKLHEGPIMGLELLGGEQGIRLTVRNTDEQALEVELLAAALVIAGDVKQRRSLTSDKLMYRWNCYFPNSGRHIVTLAMRVHENSTVTELGAVPGSIAVVKIGSFTERQVWLLACISGTASAILATIKILQEIGVF